MDLSKAFDTIDHEILLNSYGFRGVSHAWFTNYVSKKKKKKKHLVSYTSTLSFSELVKCGVPR